MVALTEWLRRGWVEPAPPPGIDLGNGRTMGAEDVLEGHFRRVASRRQPTTRQVAVQVGDSLIAAITILAPDLVPLTALAEEVSHAVPLVQPAPEFRQNLHNALERTHRQQSAQRALGTRPAALKLQRHTLGWVAFTLGLITAAIFLGRWLLPAMSRPAEV